MKTGTHLHRAATAGRCPECGEPAGALTVYCHVCGARVQVGGRAGVSIAALIGDIVLRLAFVIAIAAIGVYGLIEIGAAIVRRLR